MRSRKATKWSIIQLSLKFRNSKTPQATFLKLNPESSIWMNFFKQAGHSLTHCWSQLILLIPVLKAKNARNLILLMLHTDRTSKWWQEETKWSSVRWQLTSKKRSWQLKTAQDSQQQGPSLVWIQVQPRPLFQQLAPKACLFIKTHVN